MELPFRTGQIQGLRPSGYTAASGWRYSGADGRLVASPAPWQSPAGYVVPRHLMYNVSIVRNETGDIGYKSAGPKRPETSYSQSARIPLR